MRQIASQALTSLNRIMGLSGGGSQNVELDDSQVIQTLDVSQIVRRSQTFSTSSGWFYAVFENSHTTAGGRQSSVAPYALGAQALNAFPTPVPAGFDVWVLAASGQRISGGGGLDSGILRFSMQATQQCWGVDDSGSGTGAIATDINWGQWTSIESVSGTDCMKTDSGDTVVRPAARLRRGTNIEFHSDATAAATFQLSVIIGLFPEGLGQDAIT